MQIADEIGVSLNTLQGRTCARERLRKISTLKQYSN